jgi:hypothetical protein
MLSHDHLASLGSVSWSNRLDDRRSRRRLNRVVRRQLASSAGAAVRPLYLADALEPRCLLTTYTGTANPDSFVVVVGGGNVTVTVNGTPNVQTDAAVATIVIDALGGNDTITIVNNATTNPTTINAGDGDDTITIGGNIYDANIDSTISITDGTGTADRLVFDDTNDALGNDTYNMNAIRTFAKPGSAATTWANLSMDQVVVDGSPQASTWNVATDGAFGGTTINGGGAADTFSVGTSADLGNAIDANLRLNGGSGADTVTLDDTTETSASTYLFTVNGFNSTSMGAGIFVSYSSVTGVIVDGPAGNISQAVSVLDVSGVTGGVTLNTGDGPDTLDYGDNLVNLDLQDVPFTFNAGLGADRINVNDTNNVVTTDVYTIDDVAFSLTGTGVLTHAAVEQVVVSGSDVGTSYVISDILSTQSVTINAGGGDDSLAGNAATVDLDNTIVGNLVFNGAAGTDSIAFSDDEGADGPENYTISGSSLSKSAGTFGSFTYGGTELLNFTLDDDASLITLGAFIDGQFVTVNGGFGNDTIQNDASDEFSNDFEDATLALAGGPDTDVLDLNDTDGTAPTYSIDANFITTAAGAVSGPTNIPYNLFESVIFTTSSVASTVNVVGIDNEALSFSLNAGDGNDTVNVGGATGSDLDDPVNFRNTLLLNLAGGIGNDSLAFRDTDDEAGSDIYHIQGSQVIVAFGAAPQINFNFSTFEALRVEGSDLPHTYELDDTIVVTTLVGGSGSDAFDLTPNSSDLDLIDQATSITGGGGNDTVNFNDNLDLGGDTYTVTATNVTKSALAFAGVAYTDVDRINIVANDDANVINVVSSVLGTAYSINARDGTDTINIASGQNADTLDGEVTVFGGAGVDAVNYNDQLNPVGRVYTVNSIAAMSLDRVAAAHVVFGLDFESVTINTGSGNNSVSVNSYSVGYPNPLTVNGGAGNDSFAVGNGDFDDNVNRSVSINAGGGTDTITVNDSTDDDVGDTYTLTSSSFVDGGSAAGISLLFSAEEAVILDLPGGNETVNVTTTPSATTVNGGAGGDTVNLGGGDLDLLTGTVLFNGGNGDDRLNLDNSTDPAAGTNTLTFTAAGAVGTLTNADVAPNEIVQWDGAVEQVTLSDGGAPTTFNVDSLPAGSGVSISGGNGNDTVNAGGGDIDLNLAAGTNIPNFVGGGGTDVLNFKDGSDDAGGDTLFVSNATVQKAGQIVTYSLFESMTIAGSPQATTYTVGSLNTPATIIGGGANDTFKVGDAVATVAAGTGDIVATLAINGGSGADTVNVGSVDLDELNGFGINVDGGPGSNLLIFNDLLDTANDTYDILAGVLTKTASDFVSANFVNTDIRLEANGAINTINQNSAFNGVLNGNGGNDTFNIIGSSTVTLHGGAGLDIIKVNQDEAGTASATLDQSEDLAATEVYIGGTLIVAPSVAGDISVDTGSLAVVKGTLNVNNNFLIVRSGSLPFVVDKLTRGYNAGAWNGVPIGGTAGVINSGFANTSASNDGVGYAEIGGGVGQLNKAVYRGMNMIVGNIIVSHLLNGDANFDRVVDFADLVIIAQNYNLTGKNWLQGNFDYDAAGTVGFPELVSLAQNYNLTLPGAPAITAAIALPKSLRTAMKEQNELGVMGSLTRDVLQRQPEGRPTAIAGSDTTGRLA